MNARLKFWIVVSLVAVFAIGVAAGYLGERYVVHKRHEARNRREGSGPGHFPTVETMAKDLGLNQEQQDRIREIFKRNEAELETFGRDFHTRLGELRDKLMAEVKAVLTPEQRDRMEAKIREFMDKRKKEQNMDNRGKGESR